MEYVQEDEENDGYSQSIAVSIPSVFKRTKDGYSPLSMYCKRKNGFWPRLLLT